MFIFIVVLFVALLSKDLATAMSIISAMGVAALAFMWLQHPAPAAAAAAAEHYSSAPPSLFAPPPLRAAATTAVWRSAPPRDMGGHHGGHGGHGGYDGHSGYDRGGHHGGYDRSGHHGSGDERYRSYPGAIDYQERPPHSFGGVTPDGASDLPQWDSFGFSDLGGYEARHFAEGNPFGLNRAQAPRAAGPCTDDEANNDEYDGDDRIARSGLTRNEPTRVTAGTINRKRDLDPYLREEVEEYEDLNWWGRHEV